eukprot:TRINITY_DN8487_c0_g1_i1.p1 TRINITY_DN8487_c0_g1~~TRINITY_DN8487_c0_g1_i1.p1  ORF type:complete len:304 (-),score=60.17 TRINITY_DN8487_c0_g1_i1:1401-2312(-)
MEPKTAWDILQDRQTFHRGLIDDGLGHSHACGSLVEVCGPSSSGKTQYALGLAVRIVSDPQQTTNTNPPTNAREIVDPDSDPDPQRNTSETSHPSRSKPNRTTGASAPSRALYLHTGPASHLASRLAAMATSDATVLERIWLHHLSSWADLIRTLDRRLPASIRLIVIDSLPPLLVESSGADLDLNGERDSKDSKESKDSKDKRLTTPLGPRRTEQLFSLAARLKAIADALPCLVLVVNHVVARPDSLVPDAAPVPALGLAWSSCVNARLYIARTARMLRKVRHASLSDFRFMLACIWSHSSH